MDAAVTKGVADVFLSNGLLGAIVLVLLFAVYRLFQAYSDVQEKRIAENSESVKALNANTTSLNALTQVLSIRGNNNGA